DGIRDFHVTGVQTCALPIYDKAPENIDDIVAKLNRTASNLEKASKALSEGEGTLGALLVDAQLYNNAVEITDGAKRSFLLKEARSEERRVGKECRYRTWAEE